MKKTDSNIKKTSALFWGSIFRKPQLSGYYLEDWAKELADGSPDNEKEKYNEACFWYHYVQGNPKTFYNWLTSIENGSIPQLPMELIALYAAVHTAETPKDALNVEIRPRTSLPLHLLEHTLLAEIYLLAGRYKAAWTVLHSALQRHQSEFQSDKNLFLLGVIYDLLAREAVAHDDFFQSDNWLSKLRSITKTRGIKALEKRWQWIRMQVCIKTDKTESMMKIWGIRDAIDWPAFTDEWIAATLGNYYFMNDQSARLEQLVEELGAEFDTVLALDYLNWLREVAETHTKLPRDWSSDKKAMLLYFFDEIQDHLNSDLQEEIRVWKLEIKLQRLELSSGAEFASSNEEFPDRSFFYYLISLFVAALENLREIDGVGRLEEELLHRIRAVQMLQMCFNETRVPPIYVYDILTEISSWNPRINIAAIKGEWRSKAPVPVALFFQVLLASLASLKVAQYPTDFGISFSASSNKISMDWRFQLIDEEVSESMHTAFKSQLSRSFDELNDALYFIEQNFSHAEHDLDAYQSENAQTAWQLELKSSL